MSKVLMQISTDYDGGLSWEIQLTQINGGSFRSIVFANENNGWSASEFTDIWHTTNGGVSFVDSIEIYAYPNDFVLSQNYPNPFNPTTKIKFEIPTSSVITLKIYDVLGRELKVLIDEHKTNGKHEIVFDGSEFPSGVYFYNLQAENYIETKKMIYLK